MDLSFSGAGFMAVIQELLEKKPKEEVVNQKNKCSPLDLKGTISLYHKKGCYYFGVVDCWNKYIPRDRVNRVAGASAGSLIAAYYLLDLELSTCVKEIIGLTEDVRSRPLGVFDRSNQVVDILPRTLDKLFPEDAHKKVSGRLHVVMTRLKDMKKVIVNEFESKKDLIDALNCSCFIPVWSGNHYSTYKGVKHIDGGFTDNLPVFDEHTIRICCFSGATDISPYDKSRKELLSGTILNTPLYFTFANIKRGGRALWPPPASYILGLLERGFQDTKRFILDNDLIQCNSCWNNTDCAGRQIFNQISPSISPAISRANSYLNLNELCSHDKNNNSSKNNNLLSASNDINHNRSSFNRILNSKLKKFNKSSSSSKCDNKIKTRIHSDEINDDDLNNNNVLTPTIVIDDSANDISQSINISNSQQISPTSIETVSTFSPSSLDQDNENVALAGKQQQDDQNNNDKDSGVDESETSERKPPKISVGQKAFQERRNTLLNLDNNETSLLIVKDKFKLAPVPLPSCPPSPNLNRHCTECMTMRQEARMDLLEEELRLEAGKYRPIKEIRTGGFKNRIKSPIRWFKQLGVKTSYKFQAEPNSLEIAI